MSTYTVAGETSTSTGTYRVNGGEVEVEVNELGGIVFSGDGIRAASAEKAETAIARALGCEITTHYVAEEED